MKTLGIIAEYNPFHNGHKYHIEEARKLSSAECVIAIISGSFNQRGQICVRDKWQGARWALENGVDLVLELPAIYATSDAGTFARGGVSILEALGVDYISFGAESSAESLLSLAELLNYNKQFIDNQIRQYSKDGLSYPKAREVVLSSIIHDQNLIKCLKEPNNILALEYLNAMSKAQPIIIQRVGTGYKEAKIKDFPSSTAIRHMADNDEDYSSYVPEDVTEILSPNFDYLWEKAIVKFNELDSVNIDAINSADKGMGNLCKKTFRNTKGYADLVEKLTSKRYPSSRIQRFICQLILDIKKEDVLTKPIYARVLGCNSTGSNFLKQYKESDNHIDLITNVTKSQSFDSNIKQSLEIDIRANDMFNLIYGRDLYLYSDYVNHPVII